MRLSGAKLLLLAIATLALVPEHAVASGPTAPVDLASASWSQLSGDLESVNGQLRSIQEEVAEAQSGIADTEQKAKAFTLGLERLDEMIRDDGKPVKPTLAESLAQTRDAAKRLVVAVKGIEGASPDLMEVAARIKALAKIYTESLGHLQNPGDSKKPRKGADSGSESDKATTEPTKAQIIAKARRALKKGQAFFRAQEFLSMELTTGSERMIECLKKGTCNMRQKELFLTVLGYYTPEDEDLDWKEIRGKIFNGDKVEGVDDDAFRRVIDAFLDAPEQKGKYQAYCLLSDDRGRNELAQKIRLGGALTEDEIRKVKSVIDDQMSQKDLRLEHGNYGAILDNLRNNGVFDEVYRDAVVQALNNFVTEARGKQATDPNFALRNSVTNLDVFFEDLDSPRKLNPKQLEALQVALDQILSSSFKSETLGKIFNDAKEGEKLGFHLEYVKEALLELAKPSDETVQAKVAQIERARKELRSADAEEEPEEEGSEDDFGFSWFGDSSEEAEDSSEESGSDDQSTELFSHEQDKYEEFQQWINDPAQKQVKDLLDSNPKLLYAYEDFEAARKRLERLVDAYSGDADGIVPNLEADDIDSIKRPNETGLEQVKQEKTNLEASIARAEAAALTATTEQQAIQRVITERHANIAALAAAAGL